MSLKIFPGVIEQRLVHVKKFYQLALKQIIAHFDSLLVPPAIIKEGRHFIKDVRSSHQRRQRFSQFPPMLRRSFMILIIGGFESNEISSINKEGIHQSLS
jgi:hypothetical protein